jgi:hypothetical protein
MCGDVRKHKISADREASRQSKSSGCTCSNFVAGMITCPKCHKPCIMRGLPVSSEPDKTIKALWLLMIYNSGRGMNRIIALLNGFSLSILRCPYVPGDKDPGMNEFPYEYENEKSYHITCNITASHGIVLSAVPRSEIEHAHQLAQFHDRSVFMTMALTRIDDDGNYVGYKHSILVVICPSGEVFLVDPNRDTGNFAVEPHASAKQIEDVIQSYIKPCGLRVVHQSQWLQGVKMDINGDYSNFGLENGHCAIITLLLGTIIRDHNLTPREAMGRLGSLSPDELFAFIKVAYRLTYAQVNSYRK